MNRLVITPQNVPADGIITADCPVSLYGLKGQHIKRINITLGHRDTKAHMQALQDSECDGMIIDQIILKASPDESGKDAWMKTDYQGVALNSPDSVIKHLYAEKVHIPLKLMGKGSKCEYLHTLMTSGDGFQICGNEAVLEKADINGLLDIYPYEIDHSDVGMLFPVRGSVVLCGAGAKNVTLMKFGHPWEHPSPQGILAPDNATDSCFVVDCDLMGVHPEHGVRFGLSHNAFVTGVKTDGLIAFGDRKSKRTGSGNQVGDNCQARGVVFEDESGEVIPVTPKQEKNKVFNLQRFFDQIRGSVFGGAMSQAQVDGVQAIIDVSDDLGITRNPWIAYGLANAYHETAGTMQPIKEYGGESYHKRMYDITGDRPNIANQLGNCDAGDGAKYCGRGLTQLTGRSNYQQQGDKHGIDLINNPDLLLTDVRMSARIMMSGMVDGDFTGKKFADYDFQDGTFNAIEARRIINGFVPGKVNAKLISEYYDKFLSALEATQVSRDPIPEPESVPVQPTYYSDQARYQPQTPRADANQTANTQSTAQQNPRVTAPQPVPDDVYDEERDGPITPWPTYSTPEPEPEAQKMTLFGKISGLFDGKKTHLGMLVSGALGVAAMLGFVPGIDADTGAGMLQTALAISGTRSAIPKLLIMAVQQYAQTKNQK